VTILYIRKKKGKRGFFLKKLFFENFEFKVQKLKRKTKAAHHVMSSLEICY